jgi:hypothetical protein
LYFYLELYGTYIHTLDVISEVLNVKKDEMYKLPSRYRELRKNTDWLNEINGFKRIFGSRREELTTGQKIYITKSFKTHILKHMCRLIKGHQTDTHMLRIGEMTNAYKVLIGKSKTYKK